MDYLFQRIDSLQYSEPNLALQLCEEAVEKAKREDNMPALAQSHYWQAWLRYYELDDVSLDVAKSNASISVELFRQVGDTYWLARASGLLAAICLGQDETEQAKKNAAQAEKSVWQIRNHYEDSLWMSAYVNTLNASIFSSDSVYVRAELEKALAKYRLIKNAAGTARIYQNLALISWTSGASETIVTDYFRQALRYFEQCGSKSGLCSTLVRFGAYYTELYLRDETREDYFQLAINQLHRAWQIEEGFEVSMQLAITYHHRAAAQSRDPSLPNPYLDSMEVFYDAAIKVARLAESPEHLDVLVRNIASVCGKTGDCNIWMLKISKASREIATEKRKQAQLAQDQLAQFAEEQSRLRQRNMWITAALMMLTLAAIFIFLFFQWRVRSHNRELQAQLKMLQARINPHFIANCMNAIDSLINHERLKEASTYIIKFTRLCRNLLDHSDDTTVSIAKEIETLRYYLDLEKLRLGDQLNYEIAVHEAIDKKAVKIPLMLIQPFAENAIWHGIQSKESPGLLKIGVQAITNHQLRLTVEDDGIGRKKSKEIKSVSNWEHRSWGMDISRQRIEAIQRMKGASFEISDLTDAKGEAAGTRVTILLPIYSQRRVVLNQESV